MWRTTSGIRQSPPLGTHLRAAGGRRGRSPYAGTSYNRRRACLYWIGQETYGTTRGTTRPGRTKKNTYGRNLTTCEVSNNQTTTCYRPRGPSAPGCPRKRRTRRFPQSGVGRGPRLSTRAQLTWTVLSPVCHCALSRRLRGPHTGPS